MTCVRELDGKLRRARMITIPDVAVGTIMAAVIAGTVSFLGLVISKEQKTSEFRQAWIDALRADISLYLSHINAISDSSVSTYKNDTDRINALMPLYSKLNETNFNIVLRLNHREKLHSNIIQCLDAFQDFSQRGELGSGMIRPVEKEMLENAQQLLKAEWSRVKRGEPTFIAAKVAALLIVVTAGWLLFAQSQNHPTASAHSATQDGLSPVQLPSKPPENAGTPPPPSRP